MKTVTDYIGLHPVNLSKVYKIVTSETFDDYLFWIRLERATAITDFKIIEISSQLGILTPPHFIKIFKKHYGCTSKEFRNK
ncbi:helix-turn-helix transcriptional regulator [Paenibacillus harenae]|uniref:helix-turn-helix transcriptional regulator n=1 Tax=Paenibacillus harenae TaxID=306543 RepID=UPI0004101A3E|nr:helix-turn-helix transcriptional regulator [Paenibacillus harenae]